MSGQGDDRTSAPVACTLTADELAARRDRLLPGFLSRARAREEVAGGFRWRFDPEEDLLREAAGVIDAERRCCPFLRFTLLVEPAGGPVWIEVTGPEGSRDLLEMLTGQARA